MTILLTVVAGAVALASAGRSTWSPCGLSMLSTLTPLGERGRRRHYQSTVRWFVAGAVLGGLCLGIAIATLAVGVRALGLSNTARAAVGLVLCLVAAVSDLGLGGFGLPVHHRQVNEQWLDQFRPWVYGMGFGWQIGSGLATYIVTAGLYLTIAIGALTGFVPAVLAIGTCFGLVRGLAVLFGRNVNSTIALLELHQRIARIGPTIRLSVVGFEVTSALILLATISWAAAGAVIAVVTTVGLAYGVHSRLTQVKHADRTVGSRQSEPEQRLIVTGEW